MIHLPLVTRAGRAFRRATLPALMAAGLLTVSGCAPDIHVRGNVVDPDRLALLQPGTHTREAVRDILGLPTTYGPFDDETWYYISQIDTLPVLSRPRVLERNIVAVTFDERGRLASVAQFALEDGQDITPVARVTPTPGREFTLLQQLIGNLGRFETD